MSQRFGSAPDVSRDQPSNHWQNDDGFIYREAAGVQFFLDEPGGKFRDAVHILLAGRKVRPEYDSAAPDVSESERGEEFQVISLPPLVEMKLNSFLRKDQTHLMDMLEIGLIDSTWPSGFSPLLAARLQELIDDPNG